VNAYVKKRKDVLWKKSAQAVNSTEKAINETIKSLTAEAEKFIKKVKDTAKDNKKISLTFVNKKRSCSRNNGRRV
jgi:hypothetical protein